MTVPDQKHPAPRRGVRLLLALALLGALGSLGCASTPWGGSPDPTKPNFDPDLYRDLIKKQRASKLNEQQQPPTLEEKLAEGDAARADGDKARAMWSYLHAHKLDRSNPTPLERIASLHLKKDPQRAEAIFANLAEEHPDSPGPQTGIGLARLAKGDYEGAKIFLTRALEIDPEWAPALTTLAVTEDQLKHHEAAQELYLRALALSPADYETLNNLGVSYIASARYREAVDVLRRALLIEHRDAALHNNLGFALGRLRRYDDAAREFRQGGDEAAALNNLAYVHYLNGDYEEAVAIYEEALLLASDHSLIVLRNLGRARRAMVEAREPIASTP
jgi:Flp pilus assembly protein TadD